MTSALKTVSVVLLSTALWAGQALPALSTGDDCDPKGAGDYECTDLLRMDDDDFNRMAERVRKFPGFEDMDRRRDFCEVLFRGTLGGDCDGARRQYLVLAVNIAMGRLGPDCCFEAPGGGVKTARQVARRAGRLIQEGKCEEAAGMARKANAGKQLASCDRDAGGGDDGDSCSPRSQGYWKHQCRSKGAGFLRPYMDNVRRNPVFADLAGPKDLCLQFEQHGGCDQAELQLAAALLNVASGKLDPDCETASGGSARQVIRRATRLIQSGETSSCVQAGEMLDDLNNGRSLEGGGEHGDDDDDDEDDDHPGEGKGHEKGKGKGHEKAKGKGHQKHDD